MPQHTTPPNHSLIPPEPMPDQANAFSEHVRDLLNGQPKDEATCEEAFAGMEEMFDRIAAGLYSLASMLVGEGEDSVRLVETAVANAEVSACQDPAQARKSSRRTLAAYSRFHSGSIGSGTSGGQPGIALPGKRMA